MPSFEGLLESMKREYRNWEDYGAPAEKEYPYKSAGDLAKAVYEAWPNSLAKATVSGLTGWEMKKEEVDPVEWAIANAFGATGGILRKEVVKNLAKTGKGIVEVAKSATDPLAAQSARAGVANTMREVIPAVRDIKQEIWDPYPGAKWHFFKNPETRGDIDIDKSLMIRLHPYGATARTVFHEAGGHGLLVRPTEAIKKALVPYKGELVPATELTDYIYQVNRNWRGKKDYMENWYGTDPAEMLARVVAKDAEAGVDLEQAFLERLPKVARAFEASHPEVAERFRTPRLEMAAERAQKRLEEAALRKGEPPRGATRRELEEEMEWQGLPELKLGSAAEQDYVAKMLREAKIKGNEWEVNRLSQVKDLPQELKKYIVDWDTAEVMGNFDILTGATKPRVRGVAPKAKAVEQYYRPANMLDDGTVVWDKWARTHRQALDANIGKARGKKVVSSGALDPAGNYWEFQFLGDEIPEGVIGRDYLIKDLPKKGFFD